MNTSIKQPNSTTRYLGLRLGDPSAFAYLNVEYGSGTATVSGVWDFSSERFDSTALRVERFKHSLAELLSLGVDRVFFEERRPAGTIAGHLCHELTHQLVKTCEEFRVPLGRLSSREIKHYVVGRVSASRRDVAAGMAMRGFKRDSADEVDAIAAALCGWEATPSPIPALARGGNSIS